MTWRKPGQTRLAWMIVVFCAAAVVCLMAGTRQSRATASLSAPKAPKSVRAPAKKASSAAPSTAVLGKALFFDTTLSNPKGMSCATCHAQAAGFTFPKSSVNLEEGPVPGVVHGRVGNRRPPTIAYAVYLPVGPPQYSQALGAFMGGLFWDGRATDLQNQATFPFQNPNEMNDLLNNVGDPAMVVSALQRSHNAKLFMAVYGADIFQHPTAEVFQDITEAIASFESTEEISSFSSRYDAFVAGKAKLTASEMNGLMLVTGSTTGRPGGPPSPKFALCVLCHGIPSDPTTGPDLWTNSCYANIGVPRNPRNPYYKETDAATNPAGFNAEGESYVDLGLGGQIYLEMDLPPGNMGPGSNGQGDFLQINGTFKAPTLRNLDKRPEPDFVKCYSHNGFFKSLKQIVHFYNTRNLTTTPGEVIDFTANNPYANLTGTPLWPPPEYPSPDTLQNPIGAPPSVAAQVGNLQLTAEEEDDIVAFLKALSDGYFKP